MRRINKINILPIMPHSDPVYLVLFLSPNLREELLIDENRDRIIRIAGRQDAQDEQN